MNTTSAIQGFLTEVEYYQSSHFGNYDRERLVNAYLMLPESIRNALRPSKQALKKLWRGCDGLSEGRAISFTSNRGYAAIFGLYVIPFAELKGCLDMVCTEKCRKLDRKFDVSDDEGEVIVLRPEWNARIQLEQFRHLD